MLMELPAEPRRAAGEGGTRTDDPPLPRGARGPRVLLRAAVAGALGGDPGAGEARAGLLRPRREQKARGRRGGTPRVPGRRAAPCVETHEPRVPRQDRPRGRGGGGRRGWG